MRRDALSGLAVGLVALGGLAAGSVAGGVGRSWLLLWALPGLWGHLELARRQAGAASLSVRFSRLIRHTGVLLPLLGVLGLTLSLSGGRVLGGVVAGVFLAFGVVFYSCLVGLLLVALAEALSERAWRLGHLGLVMVCIASLGVAGAFIGVLARHAPDQLAQMTFVIGVVPVLAGLLVQASLARGRSRHPRERRRARRRTPRSRGPA